MVQRVRSHCTGYLHWSLIEVETGDWAAGRERPVPLRGNDHVRLRPEAIFWFSVLALLARFMAYG